MNAIRKFLLIVVAGLAVASCGRSDRHRPDEICKSVNDNSVCSVPFEVLYSSRESFFGKNVGLDGVLVVGVRSEPPGSKVPVMLLFPSAERARICNPEFAIELAASSNEIADELRSANGGFVTVAGKLQPSQRGHWGQIDVMAPPGMISADKVDFECMTAPPPPPTEPDK